MMLRLITLNRGINFPFRTASLSKCKASPEPSGISAVTMEDSTKCPQKFSAGGIAICNLIEDRESIDGKFKIAVVENFSSLFAKVNKLTDKNAVLEANVNKLTDKNAILVEKHQNIETENKILFEDKYIRDKFIIFGQAAALVRDNIAPAIRKESKGKIDWSDLEGEVLECADKQEPIADIYQTVLSNVKEKYAIAGRLDVPVLILLTTSRKNMFHRNIHTRTDVKLLLAEMEAFQFAHNDPAKELCKELIRIISVFKAEPMTKKTTKKLRRGTTSVNTAEL